MNVLKYITIAILGVLSILSTTPLWGGLIGIGVIVFSVVLDDWFHKKEKDALKQARKEDQARSDRADDIHHRTVEELRHND